MQSEFSPPKYCNVLQEYTTGEKKHVMVIPMYFHFLDSTINIDLLDLLLICISTLSSAFQYISKLIADMNTFLPK